MPSISDDNINEYTPQIKKGLNKAGSVGAPLIQENQSDYICICEGITGIRRTNTAEINQLLKAKRARYQAISVI